MVLMSVFYLFLPVLLFSALYFFLLLSGPLPLKVVRFCIYVMVMNYDLFMD